MLLRFSVYTALLAVGWFVHLQLDTTLSWAQQWQLITGSSPEAFAEFQFTYASLPRAILAIAVGASLALCGSLLQQMTQNHLASPITLGLSSGAWLALIATSLWWPALMVEYSAWVAMTGALLSSIFVWLVAGRYGMNGLAIILTGIAVHILCATLASALILLNEQIAQPLFIWGAGDLNQTDWQWVQWLLPKLLIIPLLVVLAHRPLTILKLGEENAAARGMALWPTMLALYLAILWLVGSVIAAVGVIGFISLLAPNLARILGSRGVIDELVSSLLLGAVLLLFTDAIAIAASQWTDNVIPSGSAATLIGAPVLLLLLRARFKAQDHTSLQLPRALFKWSMHSYTWLLLLIFISIILALTFTPVQSGVDNSASWRLHWPSGILWELRWPSLLAAIGGGAGMAVAGVILQRLIRNPLASPDILGLTAGATLALVVYATLFEQSIHSINPSIAFIGSLLALGILILLGKRHHFAPNSLILTGIALTAAMEGVTQFTLAKGSEEVYSITSWMTGSTYQASGTESLWLASAITVLAAMSVAFRHWLTLLSAGDNVASSLGLSPSLTRLALLALATMLVACVTAFVGPIAFIGLVAPHMAAMLGAKQTTHQLLLAMLLGILLMLVADWLGRSIAYPAQLPAGIIAAVIGSGYLVFLMTRRQ